MADENHADTENDQGNGSLAMEPNVGRMSQMVVCMGAAYLGLMSPLSAQEPKLRDTLQGHKDVVLSVAFSPDSKTLASSGQDKTIKLWDVATGKAKDTLMGHTGTVGCLAYSRDGKTLASGSFDKTIKLWDVATSKEGDTLKGHTNRVLALAYSRDGKMLASGGDDYTIKLWDVVAVRKRSPSRGTPRCTPWHSAETARRWPLGAMPIRSSCGKW
jgi:WD40 repeat protein